MSGTSLDGIDAVLIGVEGGIPPTGWRQLAFTCVPFSPDDRARLHALMHPRVDLAALGTANMWLGERFAQAALEVIAQAGCRPEDIDAVASHGQTVWHQPPRAGQPGGTLQLGEPSVIAERTGILTVADFRPRDMAAGGQGAPLVPFADYLLFHSSVRSVAVQNIGGIANVTYLPQGAGIDQVLAFDTGPGNMVIDALVAHYSGGAESFDRDGRGAARGRVHAVLLEELLQHPYFAQSPPKSTGREEFGAAYAQTVLARCAAFGLSADDAIATVTALTAVSIVRAYQAYIAPIGAIDVLILGGGGSYNQALQAMLAERLPGVSIHQHEDAGISGAAKEAIAFALLGHATLCGVPSNVPSVTGARHPVVLGTIVPADPRRAIKFE
jgi:anhydro-N-acetylmuramic acid kinase